MDPLLKLVVDIQNSEKVKELTNFVNQQDAAIRKLNDDLKAGTINQAAFTAAALPLAANIRGANAQLHELRSASMLSGQGLSQLAYAVDDLQYGFSAIVNNIPQVLMFLGPGIAGAAGIAAVAINQLIKHWGDLTSVLQAAWEGGSAERLKELANRAEEASAAFEKLAKAPTRYEAKGAGIIEQAIRDEPAEKVRKALTDTLLATGRGAEKHPIESDVSPIIHFLKEKLRGHEIPTTKAEQDRIQYEETAKHAAEILGGLSKPGAAGQTARDELKRAMTANPKAFSEDIKAAAKMSDPATMEQRERERQQLLNEREGRHNIEAYEKRPLSSRDPQAYQQMLNEREARHNIEAYEKLPLSSRDPKAYQAMLNERQARKNMEADEDRQRRAREHEDETRASRARGLTGGRVDSTFEERMRDPHLKRMQDIQDQKVRAVAAEMAASPFGEMAIKGQLTDKMVRQRLAKAGQNETLAPEVTAEMKRQTEENIQARMLKQGITREEAERRELDENRKRNQIGSGQILGGAKEALDMYQRAAHGTNELIKGTNARLDKVVTAVKEQKKPGGVFPKDK